MKLRLKDLQSLVEATKDELDGVKEKMGSAGKQQRVPSLSDQWYETQAFKFVQDYGSNIEDGWDEQLAHRYCASAKATSGTEVDEKKMSDAIKKRLKEREETNLSVEPVSLKEIAQRLRVDAINEERINKLYRSSRNK